MAKLFALALELRHASVPEVFPEQQDGDGMRGTRGLERVLGRVVDQDLCINFFAYLNVTRLGQVDLSFTLFEYAHQPWSTWSLAHAPQRMSTLEIARCRSPSRIYLRAARCGGIVSEGRVLTRKMTVYPVKAALPVLTGSGRYHDQLEPHLFEPLHAVQSVWNGQSVIDPVGPVIFLYFGLDEKSSQCNVDGAW